MKVLNRVLVGLLVVAGGAGTFTGIRWANQLSALSATVAEQAVEIEAKNNEIARLKAINALLKVDRRVAQIAVLDQQQDTEGVVTTVEFIEFNGDGEPIGEPLKASVRGDTVYVAYLVLKFKDEFVEADDPIRGASACFFQSLFGNEQTPDSGVILDEPGAWPERYADQDEAGVFASGLLEDFWETANDPQRAAELGIRAMHGEAPFMRVEVGAVYRLAIRSAGGLTVTREQ